MSAPREFWSDGIICTNDVEYANDLVLSGYNVFKVIEKTPEVVRKLGCFDELVEALEVLVDKNCQGVVDDPKQRLNCPMNEFHDLLKKAKGE